MTSFMPSLWEAIFTPGAPRTLQVATYTSFALLQATLLGLLAATGSYHFVALNIICACLWGAIVWFVQELEKIQEIEKEAEELRKERERRERREKEGLDVGGIEDGEVEDEEVKKDI